MRLVASLALALALAAGAAPIVAAEGATGSAVGRVTILRRGLPGPADPTWKVRFTARQGQAEPIESPLKNGVYETAPLAPGAYDVQVVDAFGQPVGAPQRVTVPEGAIRVDLRVELAKEALPGASGTRRRAKVVAIVGGAAAALALAAGGGGGDGESASPSK